MEEASKGKGEEKEGEDDHEGGGHAEEPASEPMPLTESNLEKQVGADSRYTPAACCRLLHRLQCLCVLPAIHAQPASSKRSSPPSCAMQLPSPPRNSRGKARSADGSCDTSLASRVAQADATSEREEVRSMSSAVGSDDGPNPPRPGSVPPSVDGDGADGRVSGVWRCCGRGDALIHAALHGLYCKRAFFAQSGCDCSISSPAIMDPSA